MTTNNRSSNPRNAPANGTGEFRWVVYTVADRPNGKAWWTPIGSAHVNKDKSLNVYLDALPVNGKLTIRREEKKQRDDDSANGADAWEPGR